MPETQEVNLDNLSHDDYLLARKGKPITATEQVEESEIPEVEESETVPESETGEESGEGKEPPKQKSKGGFQRKVEKLTREKYELREKIERLEREASERTAGRQAAQAKDEPKKPKMEDFNDLESYVNALTEFNTEQKVSELRAKEARESEDAEVREVYDSYNKRAAEFSAEHEDFEEVVGRDDVKIPQAVQLAVIEMENGPEVAYFLGSNPEVCQKLAEMRPIRAVVEIGKIAASLAKPSPKQKPASTAPEPIKPVSGTARSVRPLSEVDDPDEYIRRRKAEKAASRRN